MACGVRNLERTEEELPVELQTTVTPLGSPLGGFARAFAPRRPQASQLASQERHEFRVHRKLLLDGVRVDIATHSLVKYFSPWRNSSAELIVAIIALNSEGDSSPSPATS